MKRDRAHQPRIEHANPSFYTLYLWVLSGHPFVRLADKQQQQMATASDTWPNDLGAVTIDALESSRAFWHTLPFQYLFIGHALFCSLPGAQFKDKWLVHLLVSLDCSSSCSVCTISLLDCQDPCQSLYQSVLLQLTFLWGNGGGLVTAALIMVSSRQQQLALATLENLP